MKREDELSLWLVPSVLDVGSFPRSNCVRIVHRVNAHQPNRWLDCLLIRVPTIRNASLSLEVQFGKQPNRWRQHLKRRLTRASGGRVGLTYDGSSQG